MSAPNRNRTVGDDVLTAALRALVEDEGPSDLRLRVERVLRDSCAPRVASPRRLRFVFAATASVLLAVLSLFVWSRAVKERTAAGPGLAPPLASTRPHTAAPLPAVPPIQDRSPAATRSPVPPRASEVRSEVTRAALRQPAWRAPDTQPSPPWAPYRLEPPPALASEDITAPRIVFEIHTVERLPAIEALAP